MEPGGCFGQPSGFALRIDLVRSDFHLPPVMGHRGAAARAPENTLASLQMVADCGVEWVEFDVMLTGDAVPVLFHDDKLARTTGQSGLMAETAYAATRGFDAGSWFGAGFRHEPLPTLEETIAFLLDRGLRPNLEIKPSEGRDRETAEAVMDCMTERWPGAAPLPLISSFKQDCLAIAQARRPDWLRGFITLDLPDNWQEVLEQLGCVSLHIYWKRLTEAQVRAVKEAGYQVACFTVNDIKVARRLRSWGVDCMISDDPCALKTGLEA